MVFDDERDKERMKTLLAVEWLSILPSVETMSQASRYKLNIFGLDETIVYYLERKREFINNENGSLHNLFKN